MVVVWDDGVSSVDFVDNMLDWFYMPSASHLEIVSSQASTALAIDTVAANLSTSVADVSDFVFTPSCDTPDTAVPKLLFGANSFSESQICIAEGFYALIYADMTDVVNLFLIRTREDSVRVAQVFCDEYLVVTSLKSKRVRRTKNMLTLLSGVHFVSGPESFSFLSRTPF